jgi:glycosyltransferase involved in cell wall biosynthesis
LSNEELLRAYHASSLAVFSFWWATANNSLLEAIACGLPIVATDIGGVREYVGEHAGILCPPQDPETLAAAMLRLLNEPDLAETMGAAARVKALAYDYRRVAEQLAEVYRRASTRSGDERDCPVD